MLIVGRAVAGMGAAGLFSGALVIVSHMIPLRRRPGKSKAGVLSVVSQLILEKSTQALWRPCSVSPISSDQYLVVSLPKINTLPGDGVSL